MTGYGNVVVTHKNKKIHVEVKSLNGKSLDVTTRIAPIYREKEMVIRQMIASSLMRGKVDFAIWVEKDALVEATPINADMLEYYHRQIGGLSAKLGIPEPVDWFYLLTRLPDVMSKPEVETLDADEWQCVCSAIEQALGELISFRQQEGEALAVKLNQNIHQIKQLLDSIEPFEKSRVEKIRQRIIEGLKSIPEVDYDKNRLEQELIYYIEKLDINEEKQRLNNHLKYFLDTLNEPAGQGKKLGFIAQEMGREINTTGSKSNQAEMQNIVVKMKDELEQIKEQVLNIL